MVDDSVLQCIGAGDYSSVRGSSTDPEARLEWTDSDTEGYFGD